jgi:hypothetical protein
MLDSLDKIASAARRYSLIYRIHLFSSNNMLIIIKHICDVYQKVKLESVLVIIFSD